MFRAHSERTLRHSLSHTCGPVLRVLSRSRIAAFLQVYIVQYNLGVACMHAASASHWLGARRPIEDAGVCRAAQRSAAFSQILLFCSPTDLAKSRVKEKVGKPRV